MLEDRTVRIKTTDYGVTLWASADDTYEWAHRTSESWPCSELSGNRFMAEFHSGGLIDFTVNGGYIASTRVGSNELSAICADLLRDVLPTDHPAYFVTVEQFN